MELVERNYSLTGNRDNADFTLAGTLAPFSEEAQSPERRLFSFTLKLSENSSGRDMAEQTLIYSAREELDKLLPQMIPGLFAAISPEYGKGGEWRGKMWYFGSAAFWTPRVHYGVSQSTNITNFGAGLFAEFHFLDFLSLGTGVEVSPDWIAVSERGGDSYRGVAMEIPLTLKLVLKPGSWFMIEPYGGIHLNIPLYGAARPPLISWRTGLQYGIKAGPGVFFVEPRFSMDFGNSVLQTKTGRKIEYQRYIIHVGIGYKFGVKDRRRN